MYFLFPYALAKANITFINPIILKLIALVLLVSSIISILKSLDPNNKDIMKSKKIIFAIIGAILGIPLSYYFQPEMVRSKMSLLDYITKMNEIFEQKDLVGNVIFGVIVFTVIGAIIGYFMDLSENK